MEAKVDPRVLGTLKDWYLSPLLFVDQCIGAKPSNQQIDALKAITNCKRLTIRSGHGTGKDALASWIILWFLTTRPYAKVPCTAPTRHQLRNVLWAEIHKWLRQSKVKDEFVWNNERIYHKEAKEEHWAAALSINVKASDDDQAETLAGLHADHMLIVGDESSGIPDAVFNPLEGALTGPDNIAMLIGNMTQGKGYFYDTHFHKEISKFWTKLHWNSEDSSNVSADYITFMRAKYGVDSNVYRIRVLGEPPLEDPDSMVCIPLHWAQQCVGQEIEVADDEPKYLGVDVARFGDDESVVLVRQGLQVIDYHVKTKLNTIDLGAFVNQMYMDEDAAGIAIDEIGVGAGVTDWLMKRHERGIVEGVNVANKSFVTLPNGKPMFYQLRDELWWSLRDKCMRGVFSFPGGVKGEELANELATPYYEIDGSGRIKIESKKHMKVVRQISSPDRAEALLMSEVFHASAHQQFAKPEEPDDPDYDIIKVPKNINSQAWMAV